MSRHTLTLAGVFLALLAGSSLSAQDAPPATNSSIDQVTVFEDRARVDRVRTVELTAGMNSIEFTGLPISLDPSSAWVEVSGIGAQRVVARVLGLRLDRVTHEEDLRETVAELESELAALVVERRSLLANQEQEEKKKALAGEYARFLRGAMLDRSTRADPAEIEHLMGAESWVTEQTLAAESALAQIEKARNDLELRWQAASQNLARLRSNPGKTSYSATVQVEAAESATAQLRIGYDVSAAGWRPVYEARLTEASREVTWSYGAEIAQRSGEDWGDVELVLSTQRSSLGLAPPRLVPMQVGGYEVGRRSSGLVSREVARRSEPAAEASASGGEGDLSVAAIEGAGATVRFRVPVRASIPSDARPHRVPILETVLAADLAFECVPSLAPHTYRRGKLSNQSEAPFLPGTVRVFRDGAFVGHTEIESVPAGGTFALSFGVEGRIVVRRIELTDRARTVGTFQKGRRRTLGYRFTLSSRMPEPTTLILLDRVPVSEIEGVEVKATRACQPAPEIDVDGICRWPLELTSGAEREVIFEYEVTVGKGIDFPIESIR